MWKIKFRDAFTDEPLVVYADDVSFEDMPLVYIRGIRKRHRSTTIVIPDDDTWNEASEFEPLIIPFHNIVYSGVLKDQAEIRKLEPVTGTRA